jgi:hypothetical protein
MPRVIGAPTDLSGCVLWLDAQDSASVIRDGSNLVSQWSDKSGNAAHATEAVGANQPTYSATGFGGLPCLDWGAGAVAARKLTTPAISYGVFTIFVVARGDSATGYCYVHDSDNGTNREYMLSDLSPNFNVRRGGVQSCRTVGMLSSSGIFLRDATRRMVTRQFNGLHSGNIIRTDGHAEQAATFSTLSGDPGTAASSAAVYIGNRQSADLAFRGVFAEFIIYNRVLTEGEIVLVEQYLSTKWALAPRRLIVTPLAIPDCAMWFDAGQGVTSDVNGVSQWNDQSGNARHIAQSDNALKPAYNAANAAFGGRPTVDWNGVGTGTRLDRTGADNIAQPFTIVGCASIVPGATQICLFDNTAGGEVVLSRQSTNNQWQWYSGAAGLFPAPNVGARPFTFALMTNGAFTESLARINGVGCLHAVGGAQAITTFRLGTFINGFTSQNWNGSVAEFLIYRRRVTEGEIAMLEAYLKRKYAL